MIKLPDWACHDETYTPDRDRDYYITRSLLRLMLVLQALRQQAGRQQRVSALPGLSCTLLLILSLVLTQHSAYLFAVGAGEAVLLCLLPAKTLRQNLAGALLATAFCTLIVLPALWLGNGHRVLLLPAKTLLTVIALNLLQENFAWHSLTHACRQLHVPGIAIFVLDTTLRYIVLLGEEAAQLLTALKLRSVGHNPHKGRAIGGLLGVLLLRSQQMSLEMYDAMRCRCFTGDYPAPPTRLRLCRCDLLLAALTLGYLYLFLRLEVLP